MTSFFLVGGGGGGAGLGMGCSPHWGCLNRDLRALKRSTFKCPVFDYDFPLMSMLFSTGLR